MLCAIWYHFTKFLKKVENTLGEASLLIKLQALACNFTKSNNPQVFFHVFKIVQMVLNRTKRLNMILRQLFPNF